MTKQKALRRICIMVVCALLCSLSFLSVSLAKFTTSKEGSATAEIAVWNFTASTSAQAQSFEFALCEEDQKLAPGDSGSFDIYLANASDVSANYTIEAEVVGDAPAGFTATASKSSGSLGLTGSETVTVNWAWAFEGNDENDNQWYSKAGDVKTITIKVTVTGEQAPVGEQA